MSDKPKGQGAVPSAFIKLALARFQRAAEAEEGWRPAALDDLKFRAGEQWLLDVKQDRATQGRPCLTVNRIPQFVRQITNEQRAQRPSITVNPVGDGADVETAEIEQGLVRHVEVQSNAEEAYDHAFDSMVTCGRGAFRLITSYAAEDSFEMEVEIQRIKNHFSVYMDPDSKQPDHSDAKFCFIISDIPREEYANGTYKETQLASAMNFMGTGDAPAGWVTDNNIRVAEYLYVEEEPDDDMHLLEDGTVTYGKLADGITPRGTRKRTKRSVKWALINAVEVIEQTDWPGSYIPVIMVYGDDLDINGRRHLAGIVRDAKDPQRMGNYWRSAATETIALAPKAPYIIAEGQIENHETAWQRANQVADATLVYKEMPGVPPPQRQQYDPPIESIAKMLAIAENDIKAVTGIYDASLGAPGAEQSGKAILARQGQSLNANLNWSDNLARSLKYCGRQLVDLFPKIYPPAAVRRIVAPDGSTKMVAIVNSKAGGSPDAEALQGYQKIYDIGVGRYDVTVTVGPSYQSRRQEAAAAMLELIKANPAIFPLVGDLLVGSMDWPMAQQIAKRLKTMLPPQIQAEEGADDPAQLLAATQANIAQLTQQHQLLAAALQQANEIINQKMIESQTQIKLQQMKNDAAVTTAEIEAKSQQIKARMAADAAAIEMAHDAAHELAMRETAPPPVPDGAQPGTAPPSPAPQSGP